MFQFIRYLNNSRTELAFNQQYNGFLVTTFIKSQRIALKEKSHYKLNCQIYKILFVPEITI